MDEFGFPSKILIDGIDRLGKSSLIERIQQELGYYLVIHYDKPKVLANYQADASMIRAINSDTEYDVSYTSLSNDNLARRLYQEDANRSMFELMKSNAQIIFDRTHLGEMVYAPLYRKYDGGYVYEMEEDFLLSKPHTNEQDVRLILLVTSNFEMLVDDGLSFDPTKKEEEQSRFLHAFGRSRIPNKVVVDVHNGQGGYKSFEQVFQEAIYTPHKK